MPRKYGADFRQDLDPALERQVSPVIRQIASQRVLEAAAQTAAVLCSAFNTGVQTATNGVALLVAWNAEITDSDTLHDNAVNNSRFTIPTAKPGQYRIISRISIGITAGVLTQFEVRVLVNGAEVADEFTGALSVDGVIMITHEQFMNGGDYYQIQVLATGNDCDIKGGSSESYAVVNKQLI